MNRRRTRTPPTSAVLPSSGVDYHQQLQSQVDLAELDEVTDESIVSCLRERYMSDIIYTRIGPSAIIALNPHKPISSGDSLSREYISRYYVSTSTTVAPETKEGVAEGIKSDGDGKEVLPPHVYELAVNAYYDMRRTNQDQSIIFTGETGSGKSHSLQLVTQSLLSLSAAPSGKKHHKLSFQIPSSDFILTSFGHSRTLLNPTSSSRFGRYTELQFNAKGRLCGSKVLDYYLERARVVAPTYSVGERNFHVFYYLLGGAEGEERTKLKLDFNKKTPFRYLGQHSRLQQPSTPGSTPDSDHLRYDQLKSSLGAVGISKRHVPQIFQLLSAILHLGNLDFVIDRGRDEDAAVVRNRDILDIVSDFLGVSSTELEGALAYKTRSIAIGGNSSGTTGKSGKGKLGTKKVEVYTVCLDPESASDNRDDLAKFLYSLLFSWVVEQINKKLCSKDSPSASASTGTPADSEFHTFIGLLDLPGSQNLTVRPNGFDQFCVNLANERLSWWIYQKLFTDKDDEFISEGLPQFASTSSTSPSSTLATTLSLPLSSFSLSGGPKGFKPPPTTSGECVRLYQHHPGGLLHIMDDQSRRMPRKSDYTMVEAIQKRWGNHSLFKAYLPEPEPDSKDQTASTGTPATFTVTHFNGPVTYSAQSFLERNLNAVNPNFVSLLWGSHSSKTGAGRGHSRSGGGNGEGGSTNPFIRALFSKDLVNMQLLDRDEDIVVGAQQSTKPVRSPSMKKRGSRKARRSESTTVAAVPMEDTIDEEAGDADAEGAGSEGLHRADTYKSTTTADHSNADPNSALKPTLSEFNSSLSTLFTTLSETQPWFVYCINPNDSQLPNQFEVRSVRGQVKSLLLGGVTRKMVRGAGGWFEAAVEKEEFWERYGGVLNVGGDGGDEGSEDDYGGDERDGGGNMGEGRPRPQVQKDLGEVREQLGLKEGDIVVGKYKIFLTHPAFHALEDHLRQTENEQPPRHFEDPSSFGFKGIDLYALDESARPPHPTGSRNGGAAAANYDLSSPNLPLIANQSLGSGLLPYHDARSRSQSPNPPGLHRDYYSDPDEPDESIAPSSWGARSYTVDDTVPIRDKADGLAEGRRKLLGGEPKGFDDEGNATQLVIKQSAGRRRWVGLCRFLTWWVPDRALITLGRMKREDVRQAWREKLAINFLIWMMCGVVVFVLVFLVKLICPPQHVFNTNELATHTTQDNPDSVYTAIRGEVFDLGKIADQHARTITVVPEMDVLQYGGQIADPIFPVQVSALCNGINGTVSPFVMLSIQNVTDPNAQYHDFLADTLDYRPDWYFENMVIMRWTARVGFVGYTPQAIKSMASTGNSVAIHEGHVYDLTNYISNPPILGSPPNTTAPQADTNFMDDSVVQLFTQNAGSDITKALNNLNIDSATLERQKVCLRNLFLIGMVDTRNSVQCQFSTYILLAMSSLMLSVISFKFLASVNLGAPRAPQDHDKFVICQVPCYTEGETSLRRTIDSLAKTKYDDRRKLIVVICDGMIVGSGNEKPTPRIVLDILGSDPNLDPEPLSFVSLGEGARQHNMGKVYTGLYEVAGHVVPYVVIVKCGKPGEKSRPGNRGKRDSQMVLMHFFNKVHFNAPMNPLELEIYHQIKNVIGVNPTFYEYLFTVDADTTVEPDSLNRLISAMIHDKKLLGVCGETSLANAKQSIITMMQVYEYFLSHHMAKAFESLFGSVTCLPGCFTLYRLRSPDSHKPLLISNPMIQDYSENRVDTLHMKNLLHLGEDRYLTTLLLKHFPTFKTQFVRDAHAHTVAPDDWKVLLSQRRRWINSTIHNLGELVFLEQLCGFCCFSMRFVVLIDLVSTVIQPVTVAYIGYLIYLVTAGHQGIPPISLAMIGAIYGLQALVFIFRRKWDMIGWMLFYILAIPAFSFLLPLYSFWKMDDFSWGATRVVLGDSGKKIIMHDEGTFDPKAIPLKTWSEYESDLWDKEDNQSTGSWVPPYAQDGNGRNSQTASLYGRETVYDALSKSPALSNTPLPGYQSPKGHYSPMASQSQLHAPAYPAAPFSSSRPPSRLNNMDSTASLNRIATPPPRMLSGPGSRQGSTSPPMRNISTRPASQALPSDHQIDVAVQEILRTADLNRTTKREIRAQLEEKFGMDLASRKSIINSTVDRHLLART
ncbi:hypothetical protein BDN72DRAFT_879221 [Pluteus cervinus]|uniref:Uncharacterized protein n=1 Tax=Pluteus cervinus TaxID=181527 RepID=A0ACD3AT62_9AGAR|nr:hypothetical protein BDN72DRAFT_879221 [Pluteus cervinus]